MKKIFSFMVATVFAMAGSASADIFLNEIHYDNSGGDLNEFVEIVVAPSMSGVTLSDIVVELYNGSNGETYNTATLDTFTVGANVNGFQFYSLAISGIQNGAPDGLAISNSSTGTVLEFLSYEGTLTAADGAAVGLTSTDIGVAEGGGTLATESLQRIGNGSAASDFTFAGPAASTAGQANAGQSFAAVPEPSSIALLGLVGLAGAIRRRK